MNTLEDLVPPLELCKKIPAGKFEDSALVNMLQGLQKIEIPLVPSEVKQ